MLSAMRHGASTTLCLLLFAVTSPFVWSQPSLVYSIDTVFGTGQPNPNGDQGPAVQLSVGDPFGVEIGPDGQLYVTEVRNHRIWRMDRANGRAQVIAGTGQPGYTGDGGPAAAAQLNEPYEVRFALDGTLYFVEMRNHVVRRIHPDTGIIDTVAGTGSAGMSGDGGSARSAQLREPHSIALWNDNELIIADLGNHRIRQVSLDTGVITTWAGTDQRRLPRVGTEAAGQPVLGPRALFVHDRSLWVALREGHSIWRLSGQPLVWTHVAGSGQIGFADGLSASQWNGPKGICVDGQGLVYVADTENQAIRRIDVAGNKVATIAGDGTKVSGFAGDGGPATEARLARPHGICVAADGTIYVGDTLNHRVRALKPRGAAR